MKADDYLALCLEQAVLTPLQFRHGAILVRGGKVLGRGFNDHRLGFDGGALKDGRLADSKGNRAACPELKKRSFAESAGSSNVGLKRSWVPPTTNQPLSMHAEMMAIQSALAQEYRSARRHLAKLRVQRRAFESCADEARGAQKEGVKQRRRAASKESKQPSVWKESPSE